MSTVTDLEVAPAMRRINQHLPNPSPEQIKPILSELWPDQNMTDKALLTEVLIRVNRDSPIQYGLGEKKFRKMRHDLGFVTARKSGHSVESLHDAVSDVRPFYPKAGIRDMKSILFHEKGINVSRDLITAYFKSHDDEAELMKNRRHGALIRKRFWSAGFMDMMTFDQHDKFKKYGVGLHVAVEPMSGMTMWLKAHWNNNNPVVIASFYLDFIEDYGHIPLVTQSDPGTENWYIANIQAFLREWHDPDMHGCLPHRWMNSKKNIKPEIQWSQFRRRLAPGLENILQAALEDDLVRQDNMEEVFTFRSIFLPWLNKELDAFRKRINVFKKRSDRHKILPPGMPKAIAENPHEAGLLDLRIKVDPKAVEAAREMYAPPDHPVLQVVPPDFGAVFCAAYEAVGSPVVDRRNIWAIYNVTLRKIQEMRGIFPENHLQSWSYAMEDKVDEGSLCPLAPNSNPLQGGKKIVREDGSSSFYLGGLNHGAGPYDGEASVELKTQADLSEPTSGLAVALEYPSDMEDLFTDNGGGSDDDHDEDWF